VESHASEFRLYTQAGTHSVLSRLRYPADAEAGAAGDSITVSLVTGEESVLYFTGEVYRAATRGAYRELLLTDSFKKLRDTEFTAAYRKEKAAAILDDLLSACGISEKSVTCPDAELARFSTQTLPARMVLDLLVDALEQHNFPGLRYFFDEADTFHFGTLEDSGKNEGEAAAFETGKNVLRAGTGWIEILPLPIRHSRTVTFDGVEMVTTKTDLVVSGKECRATLWLEAA